MGLLWALENLILVECLEFMFCKWECISVVVKCGRLQVWSQMLFILTCTLNCNVTLYFIPSRSEVYFSISWIWSWPRDLHWSTLTNVMQTDAWKVFVALWDLPSLAALENLVTTSLWMSLTSLPDNERQMTWSSPLFHLLLGQCPHM